MTTVKQKLNKMVLIEYQLVVHFWQIKILQVILQPLELQNQFIGILKMNLIMLFYLKNIQMKKIKFI